MFGREQPSTKILQRDGRAPRVHQGEHVLLDESLHRGRNLLGSPILPRGRQRRRDNGLERAAPLKWTSSTQVEEQFSRFDPSLHVDPSVDVQIQPPLDVRLVRELRLERRIQLVQDPLLLDQGLEHGRVGLPATFDRPLSACLGAGQVLELLLDGVALLLGCGEASDQIGVLPCTLLLHTDLLRQLRLKRLQVRQCPGHQIALVSGIRAGANGRRGRVRASLDLREHRGDIVVREGWNEDAPFRVGEAALPVSVLELLEVI